MKALFFWLVFTLPLSPLAAQSPFEDLEALYNRAEPVVKNAEILAENTEGAAWGGGVITGGSLIHGQTSPQAIVLTLFREKGRVFGFPTKLEKGDLSQGLTSFLENAKANIANAGDSYYPITFEKREGTLVMRNRRYTSFGYLIPAHAHYFKKAKLKTGEEVLIIKWVWEEWQEWSGDEFLPPKEGDPIESAYGKTMGYLYIYLTGDKARPIPVKEIH